MHIEIQSLLPWYVTGALGEAEEQALTAHLARCPDCRTACEAERALATRLTAQTEPLPDAAAALARLEARQDFERPARGRLAQLMAATPPVMRRLALAQAAVIAALAVTLALVLGATLFAPRYHTVTDPVVTGASARFDVVFTAAAPQSAIQELLAANDSQIIAGPNRAGAYTVEIEGDARAVQQAFRASPLVTFVGTVTPARK